MTEQSLNLARTALVLIDLQNSNVGRELAPYTAEQAVGNCVLLAQEMRNRGAMIVYVRVLVNELPSPLADAPMRPPGAAAPPWLWATVPNEFHCAPKVLRRWANWSWLRFWLASRKVEKGRTRSSTSAKAISDATKAIRIDSPTNWTISCLRVAPSTFLRATSRARWLARAPRVLILNGPSVGVDVGSKAEIHAIIAELAAQGLGAIVISDDLPELLATCHRILVMVEGRIVEDIARAESTEEGLARRLSS